MKVEAWDGSGKNIEDTGEPGDLVCVKPFPCMPVKFWGPNGKAAYRRSYFEEFPGKSSSFLIVSSSEC
jgi:acetoacetyl-CoA synthetase